MWRITIFWGKSTMIMAMFNSYMLVYQSLPDQKWPEGNTQGYQGFFSHIFLGKDDEKHRSTSSGPFESDSCGKCMALSWCLAFFWYSYVTLGTQDMKCLVFLAAFEVLRWFIHKWRSTGPSRLLLFQWTVGQTKFADCNLWVSFFWVRTVRLAYANNQEYNII